ncbi:MAG: helix-turn-helix domain-containing protein [Paracoccaceae bacterium]|uniref:helix-turn-helix domain-containing protein n=1 Tax=Rhodobacterales TaxID=204455 RepID=UPI00329A06B9
MDAGIYASYLRCELKNRGVSLALIAEEVGVSTSLVGKTLKRQRNNKEIQEYVAAKLGVEPPQLWSLNFRGTLESIEVEEDGGDQGKAS